MGPCSLGKGSARHARHRSGDRRAEVPPDRRVRSADTVSRCDGQRLPRRLDVKRAVMFQHCPTCFWRSGRHRGDQARSRVEPTPLTALRRRPRPGQYRSEPWPLLPELARLRTDLDDPPARPPPAPRRVVGPAGRLLLRRPAALAPERSSRLDGGSWCSARSGRRRGRRCIAATGSATVVTDRRAAARRPQPRAGRDRGRRGHDREPPGGGAGPVHPGASRRPCDRRAHPRVGADDRAPAGRARAHLRRGCSTGSPA